MLPEEESGLAGALLDRSTVLCVPAFIFVELANARWFQMRAGKLNPAEAAGCTRDRRAAPLERWNGEEAVALDQGAPA